MTMDRPVFSRVLDVLALAPEGVQEHVSATAEERAALAKALDLPGIAALDAELTVLPGRGGIIHVQGELEARFEQVCVVTMEPFATAMREPVDIRFAPPDKAAAMAAAAGDDPEAEDPPDPYENDRIDLGAVVQEFFALGLDPYPRKPGAVFEFAADDKDEASPFAKLAALSQRKRN